MLTRRRHRGLGGAGFSIPFSASFDGTNDYMYRAFSAGDGDTWTLRLWWKPSSADAVYALFGVYTNANNYEIIYSYSGYLAYEAKVGGVFKVSLSWALFADTANHKEVVISRSGTTVTMEWDGVTKSPDVTTSPASGNYLINTAVTVNIGVYNGNYAPGIMSDLYFIDGTALPASTFGEDSSGIWIPKDPGSLTFGTNGAHLDFAASGDMGNDVSGLANDWTSSGPTQSTDTPTNPA